MQNIGIVKTHGNKGPERSLYKNNEPQDTHNKKTTHTIKVDGFSMENLMCCVVNLRSYCLCGNKVVVIKYQGKHAVVH